MFEQYLSKLLDQAQILLLGLAKVLQRFAKGLNVLILLPPGGIAFEQCLLLFVQYIVVLCEKALCPYHWILILQGLIVKLEGSGLIVFGLFHQHQKLSLFRTH